eukprot:TRINITY_DN10869_c0_g2_i1.p1 TRINITY_DN10869_c0_g2~~TRINITY_DN10869_c0_g2_i1.p1  ORF type:complete len:243 (-),score=45.49 TRINITY_DN10869_c0_g2_i1:78-806(-)
MIRRPPRSTLSSSSAASDVYKRQAYSSSVPVSSVPRTTLGVSTMSLNDQHELVFGGSAPAVLAIGTQPEIEMRSADVHQSQKDTELSGEVIRTDSLEGSGTDRESHVVPYYDDEEGHELYLQHLEDLGIAIPTENELDVIEDEDDLSASAATPVHNEDYHRQLSKVFTSTFTSFRDTDMATEEWIEQLNSWMVSLLPPTTSEGSSLWYRHRKTRYLWEMRDGRLRAVVDLSLIHISEPTRPY